MNDRDRRRFQRVKAPVLCRPLCRPLFGLLRNRPAIDISQGGLRLYTDEHIAPGERLEIELFLPDESTVTCDVQVVWVDALPGGSPAAFDMGLKFLDAEHPQFDQLAAVLEGNS